MDLISLMQSTSKKRKNRSFSLCYHYNYYWCSCENLNSGMVWWLRGVIFIYCYNWSTEVLLLEPDCYPYFCTVTYHDTLYHWKEHSHPNTDSKNFHLYSHSHDHKETQGTRLYLGIVYKVQFLVFFVCFFFFLYFFKCNH